MHVTLNIDRSVCDTPYDNSWDNMVWIPVLNLAFSTASLVLILLYFHEMSHVFKTMKSDYQLNLNKFEEL
jgi:hypothetical protein